MITVGFWLTYDVMARALGADTPKMSDSVVNALSSAMAAVLMYGYSVYVALNERNLQIEQKVWEQGSPRCNIRIATKAGLLTWTVIVITTVIWQWPQTLESIRELAYWVKGLLGQAQDSSRVPSFPLFLPSKIATAFPWFLAGATVSVVLSNRMAGDVRRTRTKDRLGDALVMGASLAVAVAAAQLIQMSMTDTIFHQTVSSFGLVPIIGLAGFACGATIGYFVPQRAKINLVTPSNSVNAIALEELLRHARKVFETDEAATNWIYNPRAEFGGITPAEAIGHKGLATGVRELLNDLATSQTDAGRSGKDVRLRPMLIQSG
jgi:hypothetical protein